MAIEHHSYQLADKLLTKTKALPASDTFAVTDAIDLEAQVGNNTAFLAQCELLIEAPALAVGELADGSTMTYALETDNDSAFGSAKTLHASLIVQTGAGGAGAAAATARFRLTTDVERYVRLKATNSVDDDASAKSMSLKLLF